MANKHPVPRVDFYEMYIIWLGRDTEAKWTIIMRNSQPSWRGFAYVPARQFAVNLGSERAADVAFTLELLGLFKPNLWFNSESGPVLYGHMVNVVRSRSTYESRA